jgi:hypothetical protein
MCSAALADMPGGAVETIYQVSANGTWHLALDAVDEAIKLTVSCGPKSSDVFTFSGIHVSPMRSDVVLHRQAAAHDALR